MRRNRVDSYKKAGVDIDSQERALKEIKKILKRTATSHVLTELGAFGSCVQFPSGQLKEPVLVSSCDGVGTKILIALRSGLLKGIGEDIVNHCVNDVLVQGAIHPLFFMDYFASSRLVPEEMVQVIEGMGEACIENGMALVGGETAEMPGFYVEGVFDLVGFIVSLAEKSQLLPRGTIKKGDIAIALPSNGLHTNGYSLARRIVFEKLKLKPSSKIPGMETTVAEEFLKVHSSYLKPLKRVVTGGWIKAMAHITGGGITDNIPRILPENCDLEVQVGSWEIPELFHFLKKEGKVSTEEMFRVFNMGVGMVLIAGQDRLSTLTSHLKDSGQPFNVIGSVVEGGGHVIYNIGG